MPRVRYDLGGLKPERRCDTSSFILANGLGSFLFLSDFPISKYNGLIVNFDLNMFKILENIRIRDAEYLLIENDLRSIRRFSKDNKDEIFMPEGINGFVYKISKKSLVQIDFDFKRVYDSRQYGRYHEITIEEDNIIIKFSKMTDGREDSVHLSHEFDLFCIINPSDCNLDKDYRFVDSWEEHRYPYDEIRQDAPFSRFIYRPFLFEAKGALVAVGRTKEEALEELSKLKSSKNSKRSKDLKIIRIRNRRIKKFSHAAFLCAQNSLNNLIVERDGMKRLFAGYPWFFQFWTRDESISTIGLIRTGRFLEAKAILMKYLDAVWIDGRIPNRIPMSHLGSADGVGWVFKRLRDLKLAVEKSGHKDSEDLFSEEELNHISRQLLISISRIEKTYMRDGLIFNNPLETWMDTHWQHKDEREGFCIEIQCQFLNMLRFAFELTGKEEFRKKLDDMGRLVRETFFNGSFLADRKDDFTVRPNIFIAYYHFPELLSKQEWEIVFRNSLKRLQLHWGGLSSIDKHHYLFTDHHTGLHNKSYHRGDSWFWINNLAAICLLRNNPIVFESNISAILDSSAYEILWKGSLGDHAEISDAKDLSSRGCFSQAWSSALFIELVLEAYKR